MMNNLLKQLKWYEWGWLVLFFFIAVLTSWSANDSLLMLTVLMSGVLFLVFAAKGSIYTYYFGFYNAVGYAYIAYMNGLFGEFALNLFFYVPVNIIGFFLWKKNAINTIVLMRKMSCLHLLLAFVLCSLITLILGHILSQIQGQNSPYLDSVTNVLAVLAAMMMLYRLREQWLVYIILNIFLIIMWTIRYQNGSTEALSMVVLSIAYMVNTLFGFYNWYFGKQEQEILHQIESNQSVNMADSLD
ncbi:nicotinamide riboside transporter PnuC [Neisseria sp. Ec49-e6-T10]|uniref:nicotinamide riboside transporter PnuC n=1 Tax=Neisseria sp. Ec49-e6-T10 TaxID=3140744 RepID=UPI003EBEA245